MEPNSTPPPTSGDVFYARTFALLTLALLGFVLYLIMLPFLGPLAWAIFIAFLIFPIHTWLVRRLHGRANASAALLTLSVLLIVVGPLTGLGAAFAAQVSDLLQYAQNLAADHGASGLSDLATLPILGPAIEWIQRSFDVSLAEIQRWGVQGARAVLQFLASMSGKIFLGAIGTVFGFILMMFLLFFMIRDGQQMFATFRALVPLPPSHRTRLFVDLAAVTRAVFYGSGVTALIQGTLVAIGFALVGLPSPIVFGVLAALFALVPMAGTPVVWVPAVLALAAQQRWGAAAFLLGWGVVVATIDNFIRPLLVSGRAEVATLTVFIGVLGGVSAFGSIGVFLGPLVLALVIALLRFALELRGSEAATTPAVETQETDPPAPAKRSRRKR